MPTATLPKPTEIRTQLEGLGEKINDLRGKERTDEVRTELRDAVTQVAELDTLLTIAQRSIEIEANGDGPKGGTRQLDAPDVRTLGQRFTAEDGYQEWAKRGEGGSFQTEVRTLVDSTGLHAATHTDGVGLLRPTGTPQLVPQTLRRNRLFIEDLIAGVQTTLASVPYLQEKNALTTQESAAFVAEGAAKPEAAIDFTAADAPIRKVAAWIPVTYEILQDAPTLRGYIDERLAYMIAIRREAAILNGNGTAPNIRGIRQTTGRQSQAFVGDIMTTLGLAIGKLEVVDGSADFVVLNPADYWSAVTDRHAESYDGATQGGNAPFGSPNTTVWGVPVVRTNQVATGSALIGDRTAAVVLNREGTVIRVGEQHSDYFVTNKVAILAEARLGLAVHRPDWFVDAALAAA